MPETMPTGCLVFITTLVFGLAQVRAADSPLDKLERGQIADDDRRDCAEWNLLAVLHTGARGRTVFAFSPDGKALATAVYEGVALWTFGQPQAKEQLLIKLDREHVVSALALSPDGRTLAVYAGNHALRLYDLPGPKLRVELKFPEAFHPSASIAFSPDGKFLVVANYPQGLQLHDARSGEQRNHYTFPNSSFVTGIPFTPDSRSLLTRDPKGPVRLWELATGQERAVFAMSDETLAAIAWSPDGKTLASGGQDKAVRLWDIGTGQEKSVLTGHHTPLTTLAYSADGKLLSLDRQGRAFVWDAEGKKVKDWRLPSSYTAAWAPDGRHVVFGEFARGRIFILRLPR